MNDTMGTVRDNTALSRFEMDADGEIAFARYRREGRIVIINHVETPSALRGRGIASRLMGGVLETIRHNDEKVVAACSFARAYLADHPEYGDLRG
ncbi:N-acetyltransferase domain-containing protein OS=Afipia felis OX=1035 GN=BN961_01375 PE=4 SV=1 [Afipia felis]